MPLVGQALLQNDAVFCSLCQVAWLESLLQPDCAASRRAAPLPVLELDDLVYSYASHKGCAGAGNTGKSSLCVIDATVGIDLAWRHRRAICSFWAAADPPGAKHQQICGWHKPSVTLYQFRNYRNRKYSHKK